MEEKQVEQVAVPAAREWIISGYSLFWKWIFREGLSFALIGHYVFISLTFKFDEKSIFYQDARFWAWIGIVYHFSVEVLQLFKILGKNITFKADS